MKRLPVKYIRDAAKRRYQKDEKCYICASREKLEFHHYYSVSELVKKYISINKLSPDNILEWRDDFIEAHKVELFEACVTLCSAHHANLHSIYGQHPSLATAEKQRKWVSIQRTKHV